MTIVPMIQDGFFSSTGNNKNKERSGRPRYQCNILDTDRNWIREAPLDEYEIVPNAVMVMKTPLVAKEAWDIIYNISDDDDDEEYKK